MSENLMPSILDLLKNMISSMLLNGAVFVTTFSLYFGPKFAPKLLDPLPTPWRMAALGFCIFSLTVLIFRSVPPTFRFLINTPSRLINHPIINPPNKIEGDFLIFLGNNFPNSSFDLDNMNYGKLSLTKLDLMHISSSLENKGMVEINPYSDDLVSLTKKGRAYVRKRQSLLKIHE